MGHSHVVTTDQTEPNSLMIWGAAFITVFVLVVSFLGGFLMYKTTVSMELDNKDDTDIPNSVLEMRAYESEALNSMKWMDKEAGHVEIPMSLAKKMVMKDYAN